MPNCLTLKKSNCKNCHKCIRNCPVKSIRFSAGQAHIISDECILCGRCLVVCPQNAKQIVSELEKVQVMLRSGETVIASVAPSFAANYRDVGIGGIREALKQLGFTDAEETAIGATMVKREYERMLLEEDRDIIISSCCHSVNLLIRKYFPEQLKYLADVLTPMQAHCTDIKRRYPEARTVFIGPCVAKKDEAEIYEGIVDAVITFEELTEWLKQFYAPIDLNAPMPSEEVIEEILGRMGKHRPQDELNCGTCGYNTCREKAIAIYQGKAEVSMCLPYLMERAESFSADIVRNIPNPLLVLNEQLEIQQVNVAALRMFKLYTPSDILGDRVDRVLDPSICMQVLETGRGVFNQHMYLAEYLRFVKQTVVPIEHGKLLLCILHDVTEEEEIRQRREEIQQETVEVADKVVAKQMRIVQEIASLLGETAAETKVALAKLKESIHDE